MTITTDTLEPTRDVVEPARDVELGIEVDETSNQHQDTEVEIEEKSFFASYADWFLAIFDDEEDEAVEVVEAESEQHQNEEEQPPSSPIGEVSSSRTRVEVSSPVPHEYHIPPRPRPQRSSWQEEMSFGCIDMHRCPMILKPFACLVQLLVFFAAAAIGTVYFFGIALIIFFFGGELLMYRATVSAKESNMLVEKYKNEGVNVDGNVARIWSDWERGGGGSDSPDFILVERALISYEYEDEQYQMFLCPLREHVKKSIGPQGTIPIVLFPNSPGSGIPEVNVAGLSWSLLCRSVTFSIGLAVSVLWTALPCLFLYTDKSDDEWGYFYNDDSTTSSQDSTPDWRILVAIVLLIGVLPNALFFLCKRFRDCILSVAAMLFRDRNYQ